MPSIGSKASKHCTLFLSTNKIEFGCILIGLKSTICVGLPFLNHII